MVRALQHLSDTSYARMESALVQRASREETRRNVTIAAAVGTLAIAVLISWMIAASLRRSLGRAIGVFQEIAEGHYDSEIPEGGVDEAGRVLAGLRIMQDRLRQQIAT